MATSVEIYFSKRSDLGCRESEGVPLATFLRELAQEALLASCRRENYTNPQTLALALVPNYVEGWTSDPTTRVPEPGIHNDTPTVTNNIPTPNLTAEGTSSGGPSNHGGPGGSETLDATQSTTQAYKHPSERTEENSWTPYARESLGSETAERADAQQAGSGGQSSGVNYVDDGWMNCPDEDFSIEFVSSMDAFGAHLDNPWTADDMGDGNDPSVEQPNDIAEVKDATNHAPRPREGPVNGMTELDVATWASRFRGDQALEPGRAAADVDASSTNGGAYSVNAMETDWQLPDEVLYNPFDDGHEPVYRRLVTEDRVIYQHTFAGAIVDPDEGSPGHRWEKLTEENQEQYGGNPYGYWGSADEWGTAKWFAMKEVSQADLEDLLKTPRYATNPPAFNSVSKLFDTIETRLTRFVGPKWHRRSVVLAEAPLEKLPVLFRDVKEAGDWLIGDPRFVGKIAFGPELHMNLAETNQIIDNPHTADDFHEFQWAFAPGVTQGAGIVMSDTTTLSRFSGDITAHPVYYSLANIDKELQSSISQGTWLLIRYIPKSTWDRTLASMGPLSKAQQSTVIHALNRRLYHRCMDLILTPFKCKTPHKVVDLEGNTRLIQYRLAMIGADLMEQYDIAGIGPGLCPQCEVKGKALGECRCHLACSSVTIMDNIRKVNETFHCERGRNPNVWEFLKAGKEYNLCGIQKPFWRSLPFVNICLVLSPDLLHGVHKMFFNHIHRWNLTGLGAEEYDAWLKAQLPIPGERSFPQGVSKLKQLSINDHRALECGHVAQIAHTPGPSDGGVGSDELTRVTRAIMDCIYLAQYPVHTDESLEQLRRAFATFDRLKDVWIKNGSKRGKNEKVIDDFKVLKIHILRHIVEHILRKGTMDNYNTEIMEHLHIGMVKNPYNYTNHHSSWLDQIIRRLVRYETMQQFEYWHQWYMARLMSDEQERQLNMAKTEGETNALEKDCDTSTSDSQDVIMHETTNQEGGASKGRSSGGGVRGRRRGPLHPVREAQESREDWEVPETHVIGGRGRNRNWTWDKNGLNKIDIHSAWHVNEGSFCLSWDIPRAVQTTPSPLHRIKLREDCKIRVETLLRIDDFGDFLNALCQHPYISQLPIVVYETTELHIWEAICIISPGTIHHPHPVEHHIIANLHSRSDSEAHPQWDPILYWPSGENAGVRELLNKQLHDYHVGRLALLFAIAPSPLLPQPRLLAYVQRFTSIPRRPGGPSGFFKVRKSRVGGGMSHYEIIDTVQIAWACPLAPVIKEQALRDVQGHQSLERYQEFYINGFRTPCDFSFIHSSCT
ncbi:hypothetical protein FRC11_009448 [Ceratobasidium sp. 423]|nr:hypothetical protein FRC11_009448 [Ceratobasidium sp. 423]